MEIKYLGHSCFRIKGKRATILTDPFADDIGIKFPKVSSDIVTVSHSHSDHNNVGAVSDVKRVIEGPGEYEVQGVSVIGLSTYHDEEKGAQRGKNTIYIYELGPFRVVHLGDLGHLLDDKTVEALGDVDILMIPVGGVYTINSSQAVKVTHSIEPKIVVPMHYNSDLLDKETFGQLEQIDEFLNELGLPVIRDKKLKLSSPPVDEQKAVVLEI